MTAWTIEADAAESWVVIPAIDLPPYVEAGYVADIYVRNDPWDEEMGHETTWL